MSALPRVPYLGPARVREVDDARRVRVSVPGGGQVAAELSLFVPYVARAGDRVLLLADDDAAFVIGVFDRGELALEVDGDIRVRARHGRLRLRGDRGVRLASPRLGLFADGRLEARAAQIVEQLGTLRTRVRGRLSVAAEELQEHAERSWLVQAGSVAYRVREAFRINGKAVRVG